MSVYQFALTIFVSHLCLSLKHTHTHKLFNPTASQQRTLPFGKGQQLPQAQCYQRTH